MLKKLSLIILISILSQSVLAAPKLIGVSSNDNRHFAWRSDATVTNGNSDNLTNRKKPYGFKVSPGFKVRDLLFISSNDRMHFAWYKNGMVSKGTSSKLYKVEGLRNFGVHPHKKISDLVAITSNDRKHFAWYKDGTVSTSSSASKHRSGNYMTNKRYRFRLAPGKSIHDLITISTNDNMHFAWYKDSTVSAGASHNLGNKRSRYRTYLGSVVK